MPIEYFGGNSGRYFPAGSSELRSVDSAYGATNSVGHGVSLSGVTDAVGPNHAPGHHDLGHSGIQTGGARRRRSRSSRRRSARRTVRKSSRNSRNVRRNKRKERLFS